MADTPSGAKNPLNVARQFAIPDIRPAYVGAIKSRLGQQAPENPRSVEAPRHMANKTTKMRC